MSTWWFLTWTASEIKDKVINLPGVEHLYETIHPQQINIPPFVKEYDRKVHVYTCMRICIYVHVCTYVCMYVCMYVHIHVCVCVYMYVCMYVCTYVCMSVCLYVCMYVYTYVCMYVCMYVYINILWYRLMELIITRLYRDRRKNHTLKNYKLLLHENLIFHMLYNSLPGGRISITPQVMF